jgi:pimeloyl-ACP methyl ester carboxylesterase
MGDRRFSALGVGVGAAVAATVAARSPDRAASLVLANVEPALDSAWPPDESGNHLVDAWTRSSESSITSDHAQQRVVDLGVAGPAAIQLAATFRSFDAGEILPRIVAPATVVSDLDETSVEVADRWLALLPAGELAIVASGGFLGRFDPTAFAVTVRDVFW